MPAKPGRTGRSPYMRERANSSTVTRQARGAQCFAWLKVSERSDLPFTAAFSSRAVQMARKMPATSSVASTVKRSSRRRVSIRMTNPRTKAGLGARTSRVAKLPASPRGLISRSSFARPLLKNVPFARLNRRAGQMYRCEGPPREPEIPVAARIAAGSAGYIRRVIRGPRTALVILLAAWLALAPPAALAKKRKHRPAPCSLSGSKTLLQTRSARVFYRTDAKRGTTTEYACLFARNKRFPLASGDSEPGGSGDTASLETLSGSWVAFARG